MSDLEWCYQVLELKPGASLEEVNQAYKDLVFIWHPDRIPKDNPRLLQKAQEKLKDLNSARDRLRAHRSGNPSQNGHSTRYHYYKPYPRPHESYQSSSSTQRASATNRQTEPQTRTYSQTYTQAQKPPHYQTQASHQSGASTNFNHHTSPHSSTNSRHPDLSGVDLSGQNLCEKDLSGRNLSNANLSNANLSDAFLHHVNLSGANLQRANLFRANLLQANLRQANLRDCNLIGADLSGADLSRADLTGAQIGYPNRVMVKLTGANLSGTIMPDGTVHE